MKTIIHIGQHKTGTTSIQRFLRDHRSDLAGQGVYVPSSLAGHHDPSHYILNVFALSQGRSSPMKDRLMAEKVPGYVEKELATEIGKDLKRVYSMAFQRKCGTVIWSNEGLYLLNSQSEYMRLRNLFSKFSTDIEVVCCFRDVSSFRNSYMKQLVRDNIPFSEDPDSYRYVKPDSWLFDYQHKKYLLSQVFDACTYFPYDPDDNLPGFLEAVNIEGSDGGESRGSCRNGR